MTEIAATATETAKMPTVASQVELTETLQRLQVPCVILERTGRVRWMNDSARSAFGNITGQHYSAVVVPEDVERVRKQIELKAAGVSATDYEVDVVTADGRRRRAEVSSVPVRGAHVCTGMFGIVRVEAAPRARSGRAALTKRQNQVLHLLAAGQSTVQIAGALQLSIETVRNHVRHILRALGAHSRLEAVAIARREGLLEDD
jgi:PAS domain S-box-containing protein